MIYDDLERVNLELVAQNLKIVSQAKFLGSLYGKQKVEKNEPIRLFDTLITKEGLAGVVLEGSILGVPCIVTKSNNMGSYTTFGYQRIML